MATKSRRNSLQIVTPTALDRRRWFDHIEGTSLEEIAAREQMKLSTIKASVERVKQYNAMYSQQAAETTVRQVVMDQMPGATQVFIEALSATKVETRQELRTKENFMTGESEEYVEEIREVVPDHATRIKAVDALKNLIASVQPKTPLVNVDARSQFNQQNNLTTGGNGSGLSFESLTRQIRAEKGLAIGPGSELQLPAETAQTEMDHELLKELNEEGEAEHLAILREQGRIIDAPKPEIADVEYVEEP